MDTSALSDSTLLNRFIGQLAEMTLLPLGWANGILFLYECLDVATLDRDYGWGLVHGESF